MTIWTFIRDQNKHKHENLTLDGNLLYTYATLIGGTMNKDDFGVLVILFIILVVIFYDCGTQATIN